MSAWEKLTLAQLHEAGGEAYVDEHQLTSKGKELFAQTAQSWNSYVALNPPKPNSELAQEMVRVFGEEGLNEPAEAVQVLQIVVAARPDKRGAVRGARAVRLQGAEHARRRPRLRKGDRLAPAAQRAQLKTELAAIKKNPSGAASGQSTVSQGENGTGTTSTGAAAPARAVDDHEVARGALACPVRGGSPRRGSPPGG